MRSVQVKVITPNIFEFGFLDSLPCPQVYHAKEEHHENHASRHILACVVDESQTKTVAM